MDTANGVAREDRGSRSVGKETLPRLVGLRSADLAGVANLGETAVASSSSRVEAVAGHQSLAGAGVDGAIIEKKLSA